MTKSEALLLTPVPPSPHGTGRNLRAWAWLVQLAVTHRVHVLVFGAPAAKLPEDHPAISIHHIPVRNVRETLWRRRLAKMFPFLIRRGGFGTDWLQIAPGSEHMAHALDGLKPSLIVVFRFYLHDAARPVLDRFPDARTEMDMDDLESQSRRSLARAYWRLGRWRAGLHELALSAQYAIAERALVQRYDRLYVAAPEDRLPLARLSRADVAVFPNRLAPPQSARSSRPTRLLFVGSLDYPPNELAARWFVEIAGSLRARLPDLKPTIIGRRPTDAMRRHLALCKGVDFLEDAPALSACYGSALAVLVPLRAGGGTKFKTIEAFAHRCPVIATREGVRGLGAEADRHYLHAETTAEFIDAVVRLAREPLLGQRLGDAAQRLWRERFSL